MAEGTPVRKVANKSRQPRNTFTFDLLKDQINVLLCNHVLRKVQMVVEITVFNRLFVTPRTRAINLSSNLLFTAQHLRRCL